MIVQIASAEGFSRKCDVQIVGFFKAERMRDFIMLDRRFAQALQFFFKRCAPRADIDLRVLRVKPRADFAFGTLANGEFVPQPVA